MMNNRASSSEKAIFPLIANLWPERSIGKGPYRRTPSLHSPRLDLPNKPYFLTIFVVKRTNLANANALKTR